MSIEFSFDADRHLYLVQGRQVPSVTQVLHATGLGQTTLWFLRRYSSGSESSDNMFTEPPNTWMKARWTWRAWIPELEPYLAAYQRFRRESGFQPQLIEHR